MPSKPLRVGFFHIHFAKDNIPAEYFEFCKPLPLQLIVLFTRPMELLLIRGIEDSSDKSLHILSSLHPVLGLGLGLVVVLELLALLEGLPSLLERYAWAWLMLMALHELWLSILVCFLEVKWLQSGVSSSRQESPQGLSREQGGVLVL